MFHSASSTPNQLFFFRVGKRFGYFKMQEVWKFVYNVISVIKPCRDGKLKYNSDKVKLPKATK